MDDNDLIQPPDPNHEVSYDGDEQGPDPERLYRPGKESHLAEDGASPAHPADDIPHHLPPDYPDKDTDIDSDELYQEGSDQASGDSRPPSPPFKLG